MSDLVMMEACLPAAPPSIVMHRCEFILSEGGSSKCPLSCPKILIYIDIDRGLRDKRQARSTSECDMQPPSAGTIAKCRSMSLAHIALQAMEDDHALPHLQIEALEPHEPDVVGYSPNGVGSWCTAACQD
jgi:hypothetical protein